MYDDQNRNGTHNNDIDTGTSLRLNITPYPVQRRTMTVTATLVGCIAGTSRLGDGYIFFTLVTPSLMASRRTTTVTLVVPPGLHRAIYIMVLLYYDPMVGGNVDGLLIALMRVTDLRLPTRFKPQTYVVIAAKGHTFLGGYKIIVAARAWIPGKESHSSGHASKILR